MYRTRYGEDLPSGRGSFRPKRFATSLDRSSAEDKASIPEGREGICCNSSSNFSHGSIMCFGKSEQERSGKGKEVPGLKTKRLGLRFDFLLKINKPHRWSSAVFHIKGPPGIFTGNTTDQIPSCFGAQSHPLVAVFHKKHSTSILKTLSCFFP